MIIQPKIRNNICLNSHPAGCEAEVKKQIDYVKKQGLHEGPKNVLVIGASTGYGLASRITAAFGYSANTIGISFEKEATPTRPGTPGWYNNRSFDKEAQKAGLISKSLNGDAFSHALKKETAELVKKELGKVDLVIYSLASGVRPDPDTGEMYRSVLKPMKETYTAKSVDFMTGEINQISIEPANEDEAAATVKVMGGEDWKLWIKALKDADVLASDIQTIAYSYIGPKLTFPVYREGTIGRAKEDLENTVFELTDFLKDLSGKAYVSVNKALVTRASAVIPVVPLYISLLYKIMKEMNIHEGCIEQCYRLFNSFLYSGSSPAVDDKGRIRIDNWEMREDVQEKVEEIWANLSSDNIEDYCDLDGYRSDFLKLHGFGVESIDYNAEIEPV